MVNNSQTFTCETCNKTYDSREQLKEHSINEHEGKKETLDNEELTFGCETCNATFTLQEDLEQHEIKEHEGRQ
jgi:hypothetical protein